jgi:hypothetical protein
MIQYLLMYNAALIVLCAWWYASFPQVLLKKQKKYGLWCHIAQTRCLRFLVVDVADVVVGLGSMDVFGGSVGVGRIALGAMGLVSVDVAFGRMGFWDVFVEADASGVIDEVVDDDDAIVTSDASVDAGKGVGVFAGADMDGDAGLATIGLYEENVACDMAPSPVPREAAAAAVALLRKKSAAADVAIVLVGLLLFRKC